MIAAEALPASLPLREEVLARLPFGCTWLWQPGLRISREPAPFPIVCLDAIGHMELAILSLIVLSVVPPPSRGNLFTRTLSDIVSKEDFVLDSEYLITLLVIVPKYVDRKAVGCLDLVESEVGPL